MENWPRGGDGRLKLADRGISQGVQGLDVGGDTHVSLNEECKACNLIKSGLPSLTIWLNQRGSGAHQRDVWTA